MLWLAAAGALFLAPALSHGSALGPYDLLQALGVTSRAHPHIHNVVGSDEIQEFIAWQSLAWMQVHAGHLPLWDPANLLGMPVGFNFESAPFSPTVALGYLLPLHLAHTATVAARLLIAGTGAYVASRMLRLGILPSVVAGTVFELSGAFTIWAGTYEAGIYCMAGWVLAASVALARGRRRAVPVAGLALGLALALSAGEPQVDALLVVFVAVMALAAAGARWRAGERRRAGRILLDHVLAGGAACGLVAPLYLPSLQLLLRSARSSGPYVSGLPVSDLTHLLFSDYNGVPTNPGAVIGPDNLYVSMVYVGVIGLVLALVAPALWRRRADLRAPIAGLAVLVVGFAVALFFPPVAAAMRHVPYLKVFRLDLATTLLDFGIAVLAGLGAEALLTGRRRSRAGAASGEAAGDGSTARRGEPWADRLFVAGTAVCALALLGLGLHLAAGEHLSAQEARIRAGSFLWPALSVAACAVVAAARMLGRRRGVHSAGGAGVHSAGGARTRTLLVARAGAALGGRMGICLLLAVETAFLVIGGATFLSSTSRPLAVTPAVAHLQRIVGHHLVGMGTCVENAFPDLGVMANVNADYGLAELVDYDPIIPNQYYASYGKLAGVPGTPLVPHVLCPAITSVRLARAYGVSYVLEPPGKPGPTGTRKVGVVHGEGVYFVPGSGRATLSPIATSSLVAPPAAGTRVVRATQPAPGSWRVTADARVPSLLVLRVTDVPGWHASMDGKPLRLRPYDRVMLSAVVPAGHHVVTLDYAPGSMEIGVLGTVLAAAGLGAGLLGATMQRRRRNREPDRSSDQAEGPPRPPRHQPAGVAP